MSSLFNFLESVDKFLVQIEKGLIIFILAVLILISFGQVAARNIFKVGFTWIEELTRVIVLWMAFIGGALCSEYARHMRIDVIIHMMSGNKKRVVEIIGNIFVAVICVFLLIASINHIKYQMESSVQLMLQGVPDWILSLVIPYFFIVTILRALLRIKRTILNEEHVKLPMMGSGELHENPEHAAN